MYDVMIHDDITRFMKTFFPSKIRHVYICILCDHKHDNCEYIICSTHVRLFRN